MPGEAQPGQVWLGRGCSGQLQGEWSLKAGFQNIMDFFFA